MFFHDVPDDVNAEAFAGAEPVADRDAVRDSVAVRRLAGRGDKVVVGRDDRLFPVEFQRRVAQERIGVDPDRDPRRPPQLAVAARGAGCCCSLKASEPRYITCRPTRPSRRWSKASGTVPMNLEAERLPQMHRAMVRLDDRVELDTPKPCRRSPVHHVLAERSADAAACAAGSTMKLAVAMCAPRPGRFGPILAEPRIRPASSTATTTWPGGGSIQRSCAEASSRSSGKAYVSPASTIALEESMKIDGQSAAVAVRICMAARYVRYYDQRALPKSSNRSMVYTAGEPRG